MRTAAQIVGVALLLMTVMVGAGSIYVVSTGLNAQPEPTAMETRVARTIRGFAIPREVKARSNPIGTSADDLKPGLEHFARYCAMCHGNDGSGQGAAIGRGLFPKPPDLRADATQRLTDGEIFYIIENGIRFTGMPAFGTGKPDPAGDKQVWQLVRFIRHVPRIATDEIDWMKSLNPL
jgi:mono/diheme cytochrome c family protein